MSDESSWVMKALSDDDPNCIRTVEALEEYIERIGFIPLFRCAIPGFSVEEHTAASGWWSDDPTRDPWIWRQILAERGNAAYGKFFEKKAGFISRAWLPDFVNLRRDGYDYDARWEDELASYRSKKIMDLFAEEQADRELFSYEIRQLAGFGKNGEKNFEGEITNLQMQTYLCVRDFRRKRNKRGEEYGWGTAVYCKPEHIWGYDYVTSRYRTAPEESARRILCRVKECYPEAKDKDIHKVLGIVKRIQ